MRKTQCYRKIALWEGLKLRGRNVNLSARPNFFNWNSIFFPILLNIFFEKHVVLTYLRFFLILSLAFCRNCFSETHNKKEEIKGEEGKVIVKRGDGKREIVTGREGKSKIKRRRSWGSKFNVFLEVNFF